MAQLSAGALGWLLCARVGERRPARDPGCHWSGGSKPDAAL